MKPTCFTRVARCCLSLAGILFLALPRANAATQADTLWSENWEGDFTENWFVDAGTWEVGIPTSGPGSAYEGENVGATVLDGNYSDAAPDSRLIRFNSFVVPSSDLNPRLRFWNWFGFGGGDFGRVEVSTDGGSTWEVASLHNAGNSSGVWSYASTDLSAYAGEEVQVAFFFHAGDCCGGDDSGPGWYIDEVSLISGAIEFAETEGWESGIGAWSAERGTWEVGTPTSGPGEAHTGEQVVATRLDGNYSDGASDSRLISPPFVVPSSDLNPRLRFWNWFGFGGGDFGRVEVSTDGGSTWEVASLHNAGNSSGVWSYASTDLSAYAGEEVQVAFFFHAGDCCGGDDSGPGWYIDEVTIIEDPEHIRNPENWEAGIGDWYAERGTWEVGVPSSGPPACRSVPNCAATSLGGNYSDGASDSRLVSPAFVVPDEPNPRLGFWHWFVFGGGDFGEVQIRSQGDEWEAVSNPFTGSSAVFSFFNVPLSDYVGQEVQVAFFFHAGDCCGGDDSGPGWFIDDIEIEGLIDTDSEHGGPPVPFALRGTYPNPAISTAIVAFDLPEAAEVTLRVFDVLGREVGTVTERLGAGEHRMPWRAAGLASGVYLYRVEARMPGGTETRSGRLTLLE